MRIKELHIGGFKSLGNITISEPNPFSVFVGPNAAGKSNIFEALEFLCLCRIMQPFEVPKLFGNFNDILNQSNLTKKEAEIVFNIDLGKIKPSIRFKLKYQNNTHTISTISSHYFPVPGYEGDALYHTIIEDDDLIHFFNFSRIFVGRSSLVKRKILDDTTLALDGSNLEKLLKRLLQVESIKNEMLEILQLLIPGFENIEIASEELSGSDNLLVYEEALRKPLSKRLISDGTYNILNILATIFQSDKPQFLCIEEPENGLNPKVARQLVKLLRDSCREKGHYIWLNTHSQTIVSELTTDEIILVDKIGGNTQIKQVKGMDLHGMRMDEALLTNSLGGGIPW